MPRLVAALLALAFAPFLAPAPAAAARLTFFISGVGSGTIDDVAFDGRFTFVLRGDSANYTSGFGLSKYEPLDSAALRIDGVGTAAFTEATRLGHNAREKAIYFGRLPGPGDPLGRDLFDFRVDDPVNLARPFAAMIGRDVFALNQFVDVPTSLGLVDFETSSDVRFSAVPLPASAPLLLAALAGVAALGWRRRRGTALPA